MILISCDRSNEVVSNENNVSNLNSEKTNVEEMEERYGKVFKVEKTFKDPITSSFIRLVFASTTQAKLNSFFNDNIIEFDALTKADISQIKNRNSKSFTKLSANSNNGNSQTGNSQFVDEAVVFDLLEKNLQSEDIGYSFLIKLNKEKQENKNAKVSVDWRQQTSLPFCEQLSIFCNNVSYPYYSLHKVAGVLAQTRGWVCCWNGSGSIIGEIKDDGGIWDLGIDGPRFTRVGGDGYFSQIVNYVVWYDFETGATENG